VVYILKMSGICSGDDTDDESEKHKRELAAERSALF